MSSPAYCSQETPLRFLGYKPLKPDGKPDLNSMLRITSLSAPNKFA